MLCVNIWCFVVLKSVAQPRVVKQKKCVHDASNSVKHAFQALDSEETNSANKSVEKRLEPSYFCFLAELFLFFGLNRHTFDLI